MTRRADVGPGCSAVPGQDRSLRRRRAVAVAGAGALGGLALLAAAAAGPPARVVPPASGFTSGTVAVSDAVPLGTSYFSATGLAPGDTGSTCVRVESSGSLSADALRLHAAVQEADGGRDGALLDDQAALRVEGGPASGGAGCAGFVPDAVLYDGSLAGLRAHAGWAGAVRLAPGGADWRPAPGAARRFRFTWTFGSSAATDASQGDSAQVAFTWEARRG